jgi:asparagine synthase (glutamine-hydrolysing)
MTLLAGVFSLDENQAIPQNDFTILSSTIARTPGTTERYFDQRLALVKWDCGAYGVSGYLETQNSITAITGEPYWENTLDHYSRYEDLKKLSVELGTGSVNFLNRCHGNYSVCHYDKTRQHLTLAIDKLGARPIYYAINDNILYFASAIRILEAFKNIPKRFDMTAFVEKRVFGVSLGTKTKYCDIKMLRDGQYILCDKNKFSISQYFNWSDIRQVDRDDQVLMDQCYAVFRDAVKIRSSRGKNVLSFLSGGLDSRCVVSMLNDLGKDITAFNFSIPGDKDELYGRQYADAINLKYYSDVRPWRYGVYEIVSKKIAQLGLESSGSISHPRLIFSGDGGSVGMGHVYLSHALLDAYRGKGKEAAIDYFLSRRKFQDRVFKKNIRHRLRSIPGEGLRRELKELDAATPVRDFYLFLLRNDQRRHLELYWEFIDLTRVEFLEPFYDFRLLSLVASAPIQPFIGHHFYHLWLDRFPSDAKSYPWQAYPGHEQCPIAHEDGSTTQWENYKIFSKEKENENYEEIRKHLSNNFPFHIFDRFTIYAALACFAFNLKNTGYMFDIVNSFMSDFVKTTAYCIE